MAALLFSDGSSLAGWSLSSAGIITDGTVGNPIPSIWIPPGTYAVRQVAGMLTGYYMQFDINIKNVTTRLANVYFLTSSSGVDGIMLRLDARVTNGLEGLSIAWKPNGFTSWTGLPEYGRLSVLQGSLPYGRFISVRIETRIYNSSSQFRVVFDNQECLGWTNFIVGGDRIALHGDGGNTSGAWFDNLIVGALSKIKGSALLSDGTPATKVRIRDWVSAVHMFEVAPQSDGSFSVDVPAGTYEVTVIGPSGYQPVTHGPIDAVTLT